MSSDGVNAETRLRFSPWRTFPVNSGEKACVDLHMVSYMVGTGQCCMKNPMDGKATLSNPLIGGKHWHALSGERNYNVTCM